MFFVFDLDGTLANIEHRRHHVAGGNRRWREFFAECSDDRPNEPVIAAFKAHVAAGHRVEIWSGRSDEVEAETRAWLAEQGIDPAHLTHLRPKNNYDPDDALKRAWLHACNVRPDAIYDDRNKVVAMWRAEGVPCFQVAPGNF